MAIQLDAASRNAALDAIETTIGVSPTLEIRTGSPPATCATADSGSVLATLTLPSDFMAAASGGTKALSGTWSVAASASGTPGHFRIKGGGSCRVQGTVTSTGGGGDLLTNSATVTSGATFAITAFTLTAGGA